LESVAVDTANATVAAFGRSAKTPKRWNFGRCGKDIGECKIVRRAANYQQSPRRDRAFRV